MTNKLAYLNGRKKRKCSQCKGPLNPIYERVNFVNRKGLWRNKMIVIPRYFWCLKHGLQIKEVRQQLLIKGGINEATHS